MVGSLIKLALKSLRKSKKLTQKQRDLLNARRRAISGSSRKSSIGHRPPGSPPPRKQRESKRMKELMKKGTFGKIEKEAKKGTGIFIGQKNPGRGVGRWDYSDKK